MRKDVDLKKKAVVLLSGGLDSSTCLAIASHKKFEIYALSFSYGQRNNPELQSAKQLAKSFNVKKHQIMNIDLSVFGGSALTADIPIPERDLDQAMNSGIPVTYVPGRNLIFLSLATAWAEVLGVANIFIGVNSQDYSGYPDCRVEFIEAFNKTANLATKAGIDGKGFTIHTPLMLLTKAEIIKKGTKLGVDYSKTITCYNPDETGRACGKCDSCLLRKKGFKEAKISDPTIYQK